MKYIINVTGSTQVQHASNDMETPLPLVVAENHQCWHTTPRSPLGYGMNEPMRTESELIELQSAKFREERSVGRQFAGRFKHRFGCFFCHPVSHLDINNSKICATNGIRMILYALCSRRASTFWVLMLVSGCKVTQTSNATRVGSLSLKPFQWI